MVLDWNLVGLKPINTKCAPIKQQQNYPGILNSYCLGLKSHCKQMAKTN